MPVAANANLSFLLGGRVLGNRGPDGSRDASVIVNPRGLDEIPAPGDFLIDQELTASAMSGCHWRGASDYCENCWQKKRWPLGI